MSEDEMNSDYNEEERKLEHKNFSENDGIKIINSFDPKEQPTKRILYFFNDPIELTRETKSMLFEQQIADSRNNLRGFQIDMSPDEIINLFNKKEIDKDWSFKELRPSETGKWTHSYHRYPTKFIPQIVEKLMDEYVSKENVHINDPFMGSGTTIVTAISRGMKASGTDINKIAYLITKVKSTPIEPNYLDKKINKLLKELSVLKEKQTTLFNDNIEPLIPQRHIERINYWFTEESKIELGKILRVISEEDDNIVRNFFLVGFSHILKNCSLWLQGSSKPTRDLGKKPSKPYDAFRRHLIKMKRGNDAFYKVVPEKIRKNIDEYLNIKVGDARSQPVEDESVDLIITSSPYVTSYEYADLHQLSTIWFDLADDLKEYRKEFIGTSYKNYKNKKLKSLIAIDIVDRMSRKDEKMSKEIEAFFIDMQETFNESFRILKHGGRACYVIGNTKLNGINILNAEVFAESLQYSGFKIDRIIKREIPNKILPQKRDEKTGKFANNLKANTEAYPIEYIVIGLKE
ncbi:MAG: DNA methyltransferase [Thermoplasmata archaeon]